MEAIESLVGVEVGASVWGLDDEPSIVASLGGRLRSHHADVEDLPSGLAADLAGSEIAVDFQIGEHWNNNLVFWRSRFIRAEIGVDGRSVEVFTADGRVSVFPNRPWID